jgi:hypothetical protein
MRWKWIVIGGVSLIVVALVVVYTMVVNYDFNTLKPQLTRAVQANTGRELALRGDVTVKFGLTPAVVVEDVSFQNAPWGSRPDLAKMKRLEVQVALLPLLKGEVSLQRLVLVEPDILIETDQTGRSNLLFPTRAKEVPPVAPPTSPQGGTTVPALLVNQIRIDNGRLTYKDGQTGKLHVVALKRGYADASTPDAPLKIALQGTYNDQPLEMEGTLGALLALPSPHASWPVNLRAKLGETTVTVQGTIQDVLRTRGLALTITAQGASLPALVQLADVHTVPDLGPFKVSCKVTNPGGRIAVEEIAAEVGTTALLHLKLSGAIKDVLAQQGIDLHVHMQGKELQHLQQLFGASVPVQGPFEVTARVTDAGAKAYQASEIRAVLPELDLRGTAEVRLSGPRPQLTARLASENIDVRPWLSAGTGQTAQPPQKARPTARPDKVFPQEPFAFGGLQLVDTRLELTTRQLLTPRLALHDLTIHLVLQDGHLTVQPLQARMGDGSLNGSARLQPAGKAVQVALALHLHQVDVGRVARELQVRDMLDGKLDVTVDVQGRGDSVAALMAGLNGKTALVMGKGALDNKYIELLGADLGTSVFRLVNPLRHEQPGTEINCLVSRFNIQDGIARSTDLVFDTPNMTVVGDGQINLRTEALDFSLKPAPKEGAGFSGLGKVGLSLSELTRPLKLGGTLAHPSLVVDATQAALTVGKSLGGTLLFGPVGIVAALVSGQGAGDENPCVHALAAAKTGVKRTEGKPVEEIKETLEKATEGIGAGLKKLFGR